MSINGGGTDQPSLPYGDPPTQGWAGSDTSKERAETEASTGRARDRQNAVREYLYFRKGRGATWKEVADAMGLHHGQASGALSALHKARRISRLTERRNRCAVYVLPTYVGDRQTSLPGETATHALMVDMAEFLTGLSPMSVAFLTEDEQRAYHALVARWRHRG